MSKKEKDKCVTSYVECHWGNVPVFNTQYSEYLGGGRNRGAARLQADLVIDLDPKGSSYTTPGVSTYTSYVLKLRGTDAALQTIVNKEDEYKRSQVILEIEWDDMGVVPLKPQFYQELAAALEDGSREFFEKNKRKRVILVMCAGGHGRTGTMLTILAIIMGALKPNDQAIKELRKVYCENAVETLAQAQLIAHFSTTGEMEWKVPPKKEAAGTQSQINYGSGSYYGKEYKEYKFPVKGGYDPKAGAEKEAVGVGTAGIEYDWEYDPIQTTWSKVKK